MDLAVIFKIENDSGAIGPDFKYRFPEIAIPFSTILILASIVGTIGNVMIILSVIKFKELNTTANYFIVNLSCADLCISAFVGPMNVVGILAGETYFQERMGLCVFVASVCLTSCICSLLNISAIGICRYVHILKPIYYDTIYTKTKTCLFCLLIWVVSFLLEMPNFLGWGGHVYDRKTMSCVWDRMADRSYTLFFTIFLIGAPIVITAVCYLKIYIFVRRSSSRILGHKCHLRRKNTSVTLAKTLFIIFFVFVLCWAPYSLVVAIDFNDSVSLKVHGFLVIIAHFNSSCNCVIYGLTNPQFKMAYRRLLSFSTFQMISQGYPLRSIIQVNQDNAHQMVDYEDNDLDDNDIEIGSVNTVHDINYSIMNIIENKL